MKFGTENKKAVYALSILGLVLAYEFYDNVLSGPSAPTPTVSRTASKSGIDSSAGTDVNAVAPVTTPSTQPPRVPGRAARNDSFTPVYQSKRPEDRIQDPRRVDPTLHTDLLAKLQNVPPAGAGRDLFNWATAPAPTASLGPEPTVRVKPVGTPTPILPAAPQPPPPPPPPPPINLKYYGIATRLDNGKKTAFFMDGEEILIEAEGATFGARYKLIKIGVNSAVVEDTQYKRQQTLPLEEGPLPGSGL